MSSVTNNANVSKSIAANLQAEPVDGAKQKLGSPIPQVSATTAKYQAGRTAPHARPPAERNGGYAGVATADQQPSTPTGTNLPNRASKQDIVLGLLRQSEGATIDELMDATGWQTHSVRGFLSGTVRKKLKLNLISDVIGNGVRRYRIEPAGQMGDGDRSADRPVAGGSASLQDA